MDTLEIEKQRMKNRRKNIYKNKDPKDSKKYVNELIARILISLIIFFAGIIAINTTPVGNELIKEHILKDNISFSKIANFYNKYFGSIVPFEDVIKDDATVFNEKLQYESIENSSNGYALKVKKNYLVPIINSGIVVFVGEKEGLGNTVIIQGIDEIDYWYSNVNNLSISLYDYVSKGEYLGTTNGTELYLSFKKGSEYLDYDEVIQ